MTQIVSPINSTAVMSEAIAAARSGQKDLARQLLRDITEQDPKHEQAFLWLAALAESPVVAISHLERVLELNPGNLQALNALAVHRHQADRRTSKEAVRHEEGSPRPSSLPGTRTATMSPGPPSAGVRTVSMTNSVSVSHSLPTPIDYKPIDSNNDPTRPRTTTKYVWLCPLCDGGNFDRANKCRRCGALQGIDDIFALAENRGVDEVLVAKGAEKWLQRLIGGPNLEAHLNVARAYLNLNRSAEALLHIEKACELRATDEGLQMVLGTLRSRKLVLAVDDSETVRRLISVSLERKGYRVVTAEDGIQALGRLAEHTPSLVLLDISMPKMDGYEVCKVIKRNHTLKHVPVLMLSGKDGIFDKIKGRIAGATGYISKPFDVAMLLHALDRYLGDAAEAGSKGPLKSAAR